MDGKSDDPVSLDAPLGPAETPGFEADQLAEGWNHDDEVLLHGTFAEGNFANPDDLAGFPSMSALYSYEGFEVSETGRHSQVPQDELDVDVMADGFEFTGRYRDDVDAYNHSLKVPATWTPGDVKGYAHYTLDHVEAP